MRKILALFLAFVTAVSFVACSKTTADDISYTILDGRDFSEGLAWVAVSSEKNGDAWCAVDTGGKIRFFIGGEPRTDFHNGVALIETEDITSVIDIKGNTVLKGTDDRFDDIFCLDAGGRAWVEKQTATVEGEETYFGVLNIDGGWYIPMQPAVVWDNTYYSLQVAMRYDGSFLFGDYYCFQGASGPVFDMKGKELLAYEDTTLIYNGIDNIDSIENGILCLYLEQTGEYSTVVKAGLDGSMNDFKIEGTIDGLFLIKVDLYNGLLCYGDINHPITEVRCRNLDGSPITDFSVEQFGLDPQRFTLHDVTYFKNNRFCILIQDESTGTSKFTISDSAGKALFSPIDTQSGATVISAGLAWVTDLDFSYLCFDADGRKVAKGIKSENTPIFTDGIARISYNSALSYIDITGATLKIK